MSNPRSEAPEATAESEPIIATSSETAAMPPDQKPEAAEPATERADETEMLRAELEKTRDLYLRSQAELDNFRKRSQRERDDAIRYANSVLLERLVPILDNFELGLEAARKSANAQGIVQGLAMVQKQLSDFLRDHGVDTIDAQDTEFDPAVHEAVGHESHHSVPDGGVIRQLRKGYKLRDRLIRPATVIVSSGTPKNEPGTDPAR